MKKEKKHGRLYYISTVLAVLIVISGMLAAGLVLINWKNEQQEAVLALSRTIDSMYTEEDIQTMMAGAVEEARREAQVESREELLAQLRKQFSQTSSTLSVLRPYYPDELLIASGGVYHFVPIREDFAKHSLTQDKLILSEKGELTYLDDEGNVISHKGIDVSRFQGEIDWKKVKADGVEYAFIRVGLRGYKTGEINEDEYFTKNIERAYNAGVKVGVYFFSQAINEKEAIEEAEFVIEQLEPYREMVTYPVVYDVERVAAEHVRMNELNAQERTAVTLAFLDRIEQAGYIPMVYANLEMLGVLIDMEPLERYEKWFAYYDPTLYFPYDFKVWQYSEKGSVSGIKGQVDVNISFRTWGD